MKFVNIVYWLTNSISYFTLKFIRNSSQNFRTYRSFIYSPTDALVSCLKSNINPYIKIYIKTGPPCFGVTVKPSPFVLTKVARVTTVYCRTVSHTYTNEDPIYTATPSPL